MPQKTNLNINPYFDDFDVDNNFYRVLFKPGYPIQARELTTLQSILQNQIESFGSHIFKEGSMVIPGSITFDDKYYSVKINAEHLGIDVSLYLNQLIGKRVEGQNSGVTAVVKNYSLPPSENVEDVTLYVKYVRSGSDFETNVFEDGELLILLDSLTYGNTSINSGDTVATLVDFAATATGSAVGLSAGVYFIRGTFVNVQNSLVILEPYSNTPTYRVGLNILEEIITSSDDESLNDNARGFSNYAAPGADRFKISTVLSKKDIDDFDDKNFVELIRIDNGQIKKLQDKSVYSIIKDYFAKRTFDESGNYALKNFTVDALNSLNNRVGNDGIYLSTQKTEQGNQPSDDLLCYKVSPGTAYVRGYDIDIPSSTILDVDKPRDTQTIDSALVPFEMGNLLRVNNVVGTPFVGVHTSGNTVKLLNQRKGATGSGTTYIGDARVYTLNVSDAPYTGSSTEWDLYLYDIQTYTELVLNESLNSSQCPAGSFVKGISSGASGYVSTAPTGTSLTLTQTSGAFIVGEQLKINDSLLNARSVKSLRSYSTDDIKSIYQNAVGITPALKTAFSADASLFRKIPAGFNATDRITITSAGIVTCPGKSFLGIRSDSIIRYQKAGVSTNVATFNKVVSVSADGFSMTLTSVPSVSGVCDGTLPSTSETTTFTLGIPDFKNTEKSGLYSKLNSDNVSSVNLSGSNLVVTSQVREVSTNSSGVAVVTVANTGISSAYFEAFDVERYSVFYSNGEVEQLSSDQFALNNDGTQITLSGLKASQSSNVTVNTTLRKQILQNKNKIFTRSRQLSITKTNSASTAAISGLTTSQFYGTRIEDTEISLNVPDVVNVVCVYESLDTATPILDKLTFISGLSLNTDAIVGERIIGNTSGAVAQVITLPGAGNVAEFVYLNSAKFAAGESVTFEESNITTSIQSITLGSYLDITSQFTLDKGQKEQFYDYSKLVRIENTSAPSRQLLVIFNYYTVSTNDNGDLFTVNSYDEERYLNDIPTLSSGTRASNILDFRPRVSEFTSVSASPFDYSTRSFTTLTAFSAVTPNESSLLGYSFYLPRIDRIVLDKLGQFSVIKGISALSPKPSLNVEEAMDIATISLPAYLYNPDDAVITLVDNRRYTMRDIGSLEDRIENLELTTSLSLLEVNTKTLQIQDADGLSRFKSGFFVDDFKNNDFIEKQNPDVKCDVNVDEKKLIPSVDFWSLKLEPALAESIDTTTVDFSTNVQLLDSNVRKTGDLITLNYEETGWLEQPFASQVENVNPFNIVEYVGGVTLNPSADNWVRNIYIENRRTISDGQQDGRSYDYVESVRISSEPDPFMRSRNVEFRALALRPLTTHYSFIDDISSVDIIPKLLEISMVSGSFSIGETVEAYVGSQRIISFRTAKPTHKAGPYNNPTNEYNANPYNRDQSLPAAYSASSTVLNIDTFSLADESITRFGGYVQVGARLVGTSSGAVATISNIRLVTDTFGDLIGCFFIRDPNASPVPLVRIKTGDRLFKLNQNAENVRPLPGDSASISSAQTTYSGTGIIQTQITNIIQVRNPPPPPPPPPARGGGKDPLAQSFTVDETGAFLTSVDVYFAEKDPNERLFVELRTVELGTPTSQIVADYARVALEPSQINVSSDASVKTNITFPSPVYLQPNTEYALVFLAPTTDKYKMWIAQMGQKTVGTATLPSAESVVVTKQYGGGSLFKSQNGTIWTASQFEDLKFKLYKAKFTSNQGTAVFYNPPLVPESSAIPYLGDNSIVTYPRKLKVGIVTTTTMNSILTSGKKVSNGSVSSPGSYGYVESTGGSIVSVSVANTGIGYSGGSSGGTYSNVPFYNITGSGSGATGTVNITSSGSVSSVSITNIGNGYAVGDVLGITTSSVVKGTGARISVSSINGIDTLYLTNVQGESFTNGQPLIYYDGTTAVATASTTIRGSSSEISPLYSGNILQVKQFNHGMHSDNNVVQIKNVAPDTIPVQLTANVDINSTSISIANTSVFAQFEGISTSRGYLKVNNEIMYYTSITAGSGGAGSLGISTRGVDGTSITNHVSGDVVYKYELNGISLTNINTTHTLPSNSTLKSLRGLDTYHLQIGRGQRETGNSQVSFTDEKVVGGKVVSASQNYQFNTVEPYINAITPGKNTTVNAQIRTVTGTSSGGTEVSFADKGYESVQLNKMNFLSDPRLVCSQQNETTRLTSLPKNKSFTLRVNMSTEDQNLSPVLDIQNAYMILGRNRVNNPVSDYALDGRSNNITGDPHSSVYISNRVDLQQAASSLKVLVGAYRPSGSDFRVLYQLFRPDSSGIEQSFVLFPGYDNLRDTDGDGFGDVIIDPSRNSGRPDAFVRASNAGEFLEYQFSVDNLDPFTGFAIKIVMSSTNESNAPEFKDLRVIALA
jgi:hypothetical protein